ncbi:MAG: tetratricopeptide repeat protein [Phycisphaerales bacterium]|nr:tetratricopeptide repeat protein [Phycisphaerales bacterium]
MDPARWRRERDIFNAAADLEGAEREAVLSSHCGHDLDLRRAVEALLEGGREAGSFLETPAFVGQADLFVIPSPESLLGSTIGNHRLTRLLAEGGMGLVFEARQESPARTVAVKVLKASLHDPAAAHRFRVEAETLGRLSHPGVAQIFEAGLHPLNVEGQRVLLPYFAMEYVEGAAAITTFAAQAGLNLQQRLVLTVAACEAIHHGHVRGIIHCDLKPDNILVNSEGRLKIIDFGVASSVRLETASLAGLIALRAGTVPYMSPEQQRAEALVDARSDVYSLGAVAYELVCGRPPEPSENNLQADASPRSAVQAPEALSDFDGRRVDRDLEAILRKALSANPQDRYASASELAGDLQRLLAHRPVNARSAGWPHHVRLLARRHPLGAAAAALVVITLVGGGATVGWLGSRLDQQRNATARETKRAAAIRDFVTGLVERADPRRSQRSSLTLLEVLGPSLEETERRFADDPRTAAALHSAAGGVYQSLFVPELARTHLDRAWSLLESLGEEDSEDAWWIQHRLALLDAEVGRFPEAIERMQRVVRGRERLGDAWKAAYEKHWLANIFSQASQPEKALPLLEEVRSLFESHANENQKGAYWNTTAQTLRRLDRVEEALDACERAIMHWVQAHGEQSHQVAGAQLNHAVLLRVLGRAEESLDVHRRAMAVFIAVEGEDSPQVLFGRINESGTLQVLGRFEEAVQVARDAYDGISRTYGADSLHALRALHNLSRGLALAGAFDEALAAARNAAAARETLLGPLHAETLRSQMLVGSILQDSHRDAQAAEFYTTLLGRIEGPLGAENPVAIDARVSLIESLTDSGNAPAAAEMAEPLLTAWSESLGWDAPPVQRLVEILEYIYSELGRDADLTRLKALRQSAAGPALDPASPAPER